ncbi:hypothetical protein F946_02775 [Acinetobacter johnsonii ANC 3681]|uniref:Uncharacterized protein n=2 Tax=Moraxellaceae TaxID=468 RepID=N9CTE5_ACIJO|nr:hypothetical protein F946_02775 [Acinetobacter johnsonii ANC 3681]VXA86063.1 conserved hypothetical protein [Acinetobacter sp. 8I-beige]
MIINHRRFVTMKRTQEVFDRLVSSEFSLVSFEDVKTVALAMWHENFVPQVKHLSEFSAKAAGYIVDKLMRFNCVSQELKAKLRNVLTELKAKFSFTPVKVKNCDKLAQNWGLAEDLKQQVRELLEYQTRHYKHT